MTLYTIQEFIKILENKGCHITRNKLRHYEREGLVRPIRQKREQRDRWFYTDEDVDTVLAITNLISLSWKAKEVSALLKLNQEVKAVVEKMEKTVKLLSDIFQGNATDTKDPAVSEELDFWKKFEGRFQPDNVRRIVEHYVKELDMQGIQKSAAQMLERMESGVDIVAKYNDKIIGGQDKVAKLHEEIHNYVVKIYKV